MFKDTDGPSAETLRAWKLWAEQSWVLPNHGRWSLVVEHIVRGAACGGFRAGLERGRSTVLNR